MNNITITTNNVPRPVLDYYDLNKRERAEFDYVDPEDQDDAVMRFVRYKGWVYDLHEFEAISKTQPFSPMHHLTRWHGYQSDSFFSGVVVRYADSSCGTVVMGTYYVG